MDLRTKNLEQPLIYFVFRILTIIYLHGGNADDFLKSAKTSVSIDNEPIGHSKMLGLNLGNGIFVFFFVIFPNLVAILICLYIYDLKLFSFLTFKYLFT